MAYRAAAKEPSQTGGVEAGEGNDEEVPQRPYAKNMQKLQGCRQIRDRIRKEMWFMYRNAEIAFSELDFSGTGYVTESAFLNSNLVKNRIPFSEEKIKVFF